MLILVTLYCSFISQIEFSPSTTKHRKRNPYSIEELLKKPEKIRRKNNELIEVMKKEYISDLKEDASSEDIIEIKSSEINDDTHLNVEICD